MDNNSVAVCGGGFGGLLLSYHLAELGLKVDLFTNQVSFPPSPMVHAINPATAELLKKTGVWSDLEKAEFLNMHVIHSSGKLEFSHNDAKAPYLGIIVPVTNMLNLLYQKCQKNPNIEIHIKHLTQPLKFHKDCIIITADDKEFKAKWLFAADGSNSWVRQQLPIKCILKSSNQHAIAATVLLEKNLNKTAWQKFLQTGPIALLPKAQSNQAALVWSTTDYEKLMLLDDSAFCEELNKYTPYKITKILSPRLCKGLKTQYAQQFYFQRCLLIGDAASTILPLFGQGANFTSLDIAAIIELIQNNQHLQNLGAAYNKRRLHDNLLFANIAYYLDKYSNNDILKFSNQLVNNNFIKQFLIKYALGLRSSDNIIWPNI